MGGPVITGVEKDGTYNVKMGDGQEIQIRASKETLTISKLGPGNGVDGEEYKQLQKLFGVASGIDALTQESRADQSASRPAQSKHRPLPSESSSTEEKQAPNSKTSSPELSAKELQAMRAFSEQCKESGSKGPEGAYTTRRITLPSNYELANPILTDSPNEIPFIPNEKLGQAGLFNGKSFLLPEEAKRLPDGSIALPVRAMTTEGEINDQGYFKFIPKASGYDLRAFLLTMADGKELQSPQVFEITMSKNASLPNSETHKPNSPNTGNPAAGPVAPKVELDQAYENPHSVTGALIAMEEFLGPNRRWTSDNQEANSFLGNMPSYKKDLDTLAKYVSTKAQRGGVDQINKFLKEKGLDIALKPVLDNDTVCGAAVLDIPVKWSQKGQATRLRHDSGNTLDAVRQQIEGVYEVPGRSNPIVQLGTKSGERVFMTKLTETEKEEKHSRNLALSLSKNMRAWEGKAQEVIFPMVDYSNTEKLESLVGAKTEDASGAKVKIDQAVAQQKLRMNEDGARAQAGAAAAASKGIDSSSPRPIVINGDMLVWFEAENLIPFSAIVHEKDMHRPANLD